MKTLVFVTRKIPDPGIPLLKSRKDCIVKVFQGRGAIPRSQLLRSVRGATAILSLVTEKIDAAVFDAAGKHLKIVANYAVGYDNIDLKAAAARGIIVTNTPGVLTDSVSEHAFALMMAVCHRIPESDAFTRAGKYKVWSPFLFLGTELKGKTLGVVGLGRIGFGVAERAVKGMGMKVLYNDVRRNDDFEKIYGAHYRDLDTLLAESDIVSLHVPLSSATRHLIDAERLRLMKKTAFLINTSRGPIIDEKALVAALKAKRIAGAALDVFEFEPKLSPGLVKLPNVVLTPHTASATIEARSEMAELAAQSIIAILDGKMPHSVVRP